MTMIDQVAKAIYDHANTRGEESFDQAPEEMREWFRGHARAAMEAMREPTHNMVGMGSLMCDEKTPEQDQARARGVWWGMLDAALKGS